MTCKETRAVTCEYLEGTLSGPVAASISYHLQVCESCRMLIDAARQTLELYFGRPVETLPLKLKTKRVA